MFHPAIAYDDPGPTATRVNWPPTESTASLMVTVWPVVASFTWIEPSIETLVTRCEEASALVGMCVGRTVAAIYLPMRDVVGVRSDPSRSKAYLRSVPSCLFPCLSLLCVFPVEPQWCKRRFLSPPTVACPSSYWPAAAQRVSGGREQLPDAVALGVSQIIDRGLQFVLCDLCDVVPMS
jgi:hypothetical protein